ncbi:MAG TPA: hypothetical protein VET90_02385, partial [Candidatus Binatus sp.]|nr:hypothetical protein [Candidatus Binatus sp.]
MPTSYALLDAGGKRRLERFGPLVLDRPAPAATASPRLPAAWSTADLRFDPSRGWSAASDHSAGLAAPGQAIPREPWTIEVAGLALELRPTSSGGVGLYPEHATNLPWLHAEVRAAVTTKGSAEVLNLFAHTGLATLAAARAGASVAHVDASRSAVDWARRNAELSALADRPIR